MRLLLLPIVLVASACATTLPPVTATDQPARVGVLVMAHGGSAEWDDAITEAVASLATEVPTEVAFGMADPVTLASGVAALEARGVDRVALVRLFLSGTSFLHQTEYLLGLRADRPRWFVTHGAGHGADPAPIEHAVDIATHQDGLSDSEELTKVVADRVGAVSLKPSRESVLLLAHGVGDDAQNERLLERMRAASRDLEGQGFRKLRVAALREDWADKRASAEREIRTFVESEVDAGANVIVVPFRLFGEGPYDDVLKGLDYQMAESLMPHAVVNNWIRETASRVSCVEGWASSSPLCSALVVGPR